MADPVEDLETGLPLRVLLLPLSVVGAVLAVFIAGKMGFVSGLDGLIGQAGSYAGSFWGLPVLIGIFCIGAFLGVPQFALMGGAVVAFGPLLGLGYAWAATLCSGALTFWTGRLGGETLFKRYAGRRGAKLSGFLGRNGFMASLLVRLVPTGPFILVNMAFGVSKARFPAFLAGLAIGALPKLGLVALAGQGLIAAEQGAIWIAGCAVIAVMLIWGGMVWLGRTQKKT